MHGFGRAHTFSPMGFTFRHRRKKILAGSVEELKNFFRQCDTDHDGRLDYREVKSAFRKLGSNAPAWRALLAILRADESGDGCIKEHELDKLLDYAVELGYAVITPTPKVE